MERGPRAAVGQSSMRTKVVRRLGASTTGLLLMLSGCEQTEEAGVTATVAAAPVHFLDCEDAACQKELALRFFEEDRERLSEELSLLEEPIVRVALIEVVSQAHPGEALDLCRLIEGTDRERCLRINEPPHLTWKGTERPSRGFQPSQVSLAPSPGVTPPTLPEVAPLAVPCEHGLLQTRCQTDAAVKAARLKDWAPAFAACTAIEDVRWRQECMFQSAEAGIETVDTASSRRVADLCLASGGFLPECLAHLTMALADAAPAASAAPEAWGPVIGAVDTFRERLAWDPSLAERFEMRAWSEIAWRSYLSVAQVTDGPAHGRGSPERPSTRRLCRRLAAMAAR